MNNAAINLPAWDAEATESTLTVNLDGPVRLTYAFAESLAPATGALVVQVRLLRVRLWSR